jgi:hypothetical protein
MKKMICTFLNNILIYCCSVEIEYLEMLNNNAQTFSVGHRYGRSFLIMERFDETQVYASQEFQVY